jgi:hypothetical protein
MKLGMRRCIRPILGVLMVLSAIVAGPAFAQSAKAPLGLDQLAQREIVVGTKEAAPFSMKSPGGEWRRRLREKWTLRSRR